MVQHILEMSQLLQLMLQLMVEIKLHLAFFLYNSTHQLIFSFRPNSYQRTNTPLMLSCLLLALAHPSLTDNSVLVTPLPLVMRQLQQPQAPSHMQPYDIQQQHHVSSFGGHAQSSTPQYTDLASVFQVMSIQQPPDNNYYMDYGASSHMSFNSGNMISVTPCNSKFSKPPSFK